MCPNNWDLEREEWTRRVMAVLSEHSVDVVRFDMRSVRPVGDPVGTLPVRGSEAGPNVPRSEEVQRGDQ